MVKIWVKTKIVPRKSGRLRSPNWHYPKVALPQLSLPQSGPSPNWHYPQVALLPTGPYPTGPRLGLKSPNCRYTEWGRSPQRRLTNKSFLLFFCLGTFFLSTIDYDQEHDNTNLWYPRLQMFLFKWNFSPNLNGISLRIFLLTRMDAHKNFINKQQKLRRMDAVVNCATLQRILERCFSTELMLFWRCFAWSEGWF